MKLRTPETYWLLKNGLTHSYPSLKQDLTCDVVIVGGGITGALLAWQCSNDGYNTVLIDKHDVSLGSTSATTAILQYELDEPLHTLIDKVGENAAVDTYMHGIKMIDDLAHIVHTRDFDCDFQMKNSVFFARTEDEAEWLEKEFECRKRCGLNVSWISKAELLKHYHINACGAIFSDKAAVVDAHLLSHRLLHDAVVHRNLQVYDHTGLKEVSYEGKHQVVLTDGDCKITTQRVVYATGYETQNFLSEKVANLNSTYAMVSEPLKVIPPAISTSVFWDTGSPYFYMRTTEDNRMIIGGGDESFQNAQLRDMLIEKKENELYAMFRETVPDMDITPDYCWAGTFGETKDSMPYIGEHPDHANSFFVLGYGGNGITFSLMGMKMLSDAMAGRTNKFTNYFKFNR